MAMPFWLKLSPCDPNTRKTFRSSFLPMASSSPVASETGTVGSFSLIGTEMDTGSDYMLLSTTETEAAPAEVVTDFECDPNLTKETLAAQLQEMEKVMAHLGLDPKQETGVAASGAKPPSGFVQAASSATRSTLQTLEKETLTIHMDQNTDTFTIEGWESLVPALPSSAEALPPSISETSLMGNFALFWMHSAALRGRHPWLPRSRRCTTSRSERPPTQMLKIRHTTQRGGSMSNLKEEDPGTSPQLVCSDCSAPWGQFSKCLLCQGSSPVDLSVTPLSVIEVEGQSWQLRITEAGPTWVPSDTKVTKAAGLVEVGDLGRPPPTAASGAGMELVSFSEQVPASQRLTLQQHVAEFGQDEIFHPDGVRPPTIADKDSTQTAVIFHPKTIQMMRFKADLLATPEDDLTEAAQEPRSARRNSSNNKKLPRWMTSSTPWPPSSRGHKRSRTRWVRSYFAMQIFSSFDPFSNENTKKVESPPHTKRCGQHRRRKRRLRPPTRPWTQSSEAAVWPSNPSRWLPSRFGLQNCKRHGRATSSPQPWEHRDRSSLTWRPLSSRTFEWRNWSRTTSPLSPRTALTSPLWYWRIESRIAYFRSRLSGARRRASWASWEGAISSRKVYMSSWVLGNSIIKRSWERGGLLSLISSFIRRYGCLRASMSNCHWGYGKAASLLSSYGVPSQLAQDSVIWGQHLVRFPGQPMRTGGGLPFR